MRSLRFIKTQAVRDGLAKRIRILRHRREGKPYATQAIFGLLIYEASNTSATIEREIRKRSIMKDQSSLSIPKFSRFKCSFCGREFDILPNLMYPIHAYPCPYCKEINDTVKIAGEKGHE